MTAFCASCAGEIAGGPVLRAGWLYCSISCAREPGAALAAAARVQVSAPAARADAANHFAKSGPPALTG